MKRITLLMTAMSIQFTSIATESEPLLLERWLKLEQQTGSLQVNWAEREVVLKQQLSLLKKEETALRKIIKSGNDNSNKVSRERIEIAKKQLALEKYNDSTQNQITLTIDYINHIVNRLPTPLRAQWKKSIEHLNSVNEPSMQLETIFKLLKQVDDFDKRVALHSGLIEIPSDQGTKKVLVEQVYLGLTHGWYISKDKQYYGYGRSENDTWQWWHNDQSKTVLGKTLTADSITEVVNILRSPTSARYIKLPLALAPSKKEVL